MTRCRYCDQHIYVFDKAPEWAALSETDNRGWARDETGDPVEDFICPARQGSARFPEGRPHEPIPPGECQHDAVETNQHGDAWCADCGERLLLPGYAGGEEA